MNSSKNIFIKDLNVGQDVETPFLVTTVSRGQTSRGSLYLNVELADRTGKIAGKVWDDAEAAAKRLGEGTVVVVSAYVDNYRGALQLVIRDCRPLEDDLIEWADFLKAASRPMETMKAELWALVAGLADEDYRRLVSAVLKSPEVDDKFYVMPAAKNMHHAYRCGLLEHSLSVGRLARNMADHYGPKLYGDLLVAGAILHDLGKIWEFSQTPKTDYTTPGRLVGHLVIGAGFIAETAEKIPNFPKEKLLLLQHLILSHHGEHEFGAPVRPQLLEALALHHLDSMDAKLEAVESFIDSGANDEGWSGYHRLLGSYFLRTPVYEPQEPPEPEPEKPLPRVEEDEALAEPEEAIEEKEESWLFD